jgi:8-oxo-dGTP diphosphatase
MPVLTPEQASKLTSLSDIDWEKWQPKQKATLLFVFQGDEVLLIRKKRGLGSGKINAAGGRLEGGETEQECAVRELEEELHIHVSDPKYAGEIDFQFLDGYCFHLIVFTGTQYTGTPTETDEAIPIWFNREQIPYEEMWEDDIYWVPLMLRGEPFYGRFLFNDDTLVDGWMAPTEEIEHYLASSDKNELS